MAAQTRYFTNQTPADLDISGRIDSVGAVRAKRIGKIVIALAIVALLVFAALMLVRFVNERGGLGALFGGSQAAVSTPASTAFDSQALNDQSSAFGQGASASGQAVAAGKLAGAVETVDENGLVHGTTPAGINYTVLGRGAVGANADRVTMVAVGDQIGTDNNLPLAANYGARVGAPYDFTPFYQEVAPIIQQYDLRYVNQETVMAGDGYQVSGWPVFNSPDACAWALANVGFNMVNFCSNHTSDMGLEATERSLTLLESLRQFLIDGCYRNQQERQTVHMIERNGITFASLGYTFLDNTYGYDAANFPDPNLVCGFDKALIEADVRRAQQVADVVIVSMHWGDEYTYIVNDLQYEYAAFLADLGVDLVLGSHAHNMQPTEYITGSTGNTIPVVFGLSDFVSGWTLMDTILSGMFTCDWVRQADGSVACQNLLWYPTIEWSDGGDVYVRRLCDMDQYTCDINTRIDDVGGSYYEYIYNYVNNVGMQIPIVM